MGLWLVNAFGSRDGFFNKDLTIAVLKSDVTVQVVRERIVKAGERTSRFSHRNLLGNALSSHVFGTDF